MSSILTSQIEMTEARTQTSNAMISLAKEIAGVLTLFVCAAVPIVLLSLTWV
jgi:hypothetical protein